MGVLSRCKRADMRQLIYRNAQPSRNYRIQSRHSHSGNFHPRQNQMTTVGLWICHPPNTRQFKQIWKGPRPAIVFAILAQNHTPEPMEATAAAAAWRKAIISAAVAVHSWFEVNFPPTISATTPSSKKKSGRSYVQY